MKIKENKAHQSGGIEGAFQLVIGVCLLFWFLYNDNFSDQLWSEKTTVDWFVVAFKYAFASALITGNTPQDAMIVIRIYISGAFNLFMRLSPNRQR